MYITDQVKLVLKKCTISILSSIFFASLVFLYPGVVFSQGQSVSITPALYNISVTPGQVWSSKIRVINPNNYPLTVYVEPVNFIAEGERGVGRHISIAKSEESGVTVAEWFTVTAGPYTIGANQAQEIDFILSVPKFASPGSQSAALLISTSPPDETTGIQISTSQAVSSVFLVRVDGDVTEKLDIRSFSVTDRLVTSPKNTFSLRFENTGTVHMQPQGLITIYNFWGEERGVIPINQRSLFGNVMPDSMRVFQYSWAGESSMLDFGRYRAEAVVSYGVNQRQTLTQTIYFWVIPIKGIAYTLGTFFILVFIVVISVRLYVRKILASVGLDKDVILKRAKKEESSEEENVIEGSILKTTYLHLVNSYSDFKLNLSQTSSFKEVTVLLKSIVSKNYFLLVVITVLLIFVTLLVVYIRQVTVPERGYTVILHDEQDVMVSSEDVYFDSLSINSELRIQPLQAAEGIFEEFSSISLINTSGVVGLAAELKLQLVTRGIEVSTITIDTERSDQRTVVVYPRAKQNEALLLSRILGGVPISSVDESEEIKIFVGSDIIKK